MGSFRTSSIASSRRIVRIESGVCRSGVDDPSILHPICTPEEWNDLRDKLAYRYIASLILLGLKDVALSEYQSRAGQLVTSKNYIQRLDAIFANDELSPSTLRVVWPLLGEFT
jgi:hypothetical protein